MVARALSRLPLHAPRALAHSLLTCLLRGVAPSSSRSVSTMPGDRLCTPTGCGSAAASRSSERRSCAMPALVAPYAEYCGERSREKRG